MKVPPLSRKGTPQPPEDPNLKSNTKKPSVIVMAGNKPNPPNPLTPVVPRVRTSTTNQRTTPSSRNLHPNVSARSPNLLGGRKSRADTISSPDTLTPTRPLSVASNRPSSSMGFKAPISRRESQEHSTTNGRPGLINGRNSPMFFHASEISSASSQKQQAHEPHTPKLFVGDKAQLGSSNLTVSSGIPSQTLRPLNNAPPSPRLGLNPPNLAPACKQSAQFSPPATRPSSIIGVQQTRPSPVIGTSLPPLPSLTPATAPPTDNRNHVKFVYANGTEELLPPRKSGSEGSAMASPPLTSSPEFANPASPNGTDFTSSPLGSPNPIVSPHQYFQRHVVSTHSRRTSLEYKPQIGRPGRAVSISSPNASEILLGSGERPIPHHDVSDNHASEEKEPGDEEHSTPILPVPSIGKTKLQEMEELATNARRERKVMDLEISNTSLMAINKTLEREMRRQAAELRRYKRLSRSGRLSARPSSFEPSLESMDASDAMDSASEADTTSVVGTETDYSGSEVDKNEEIEEEEEDEDTEVESMDEEDDSEADDSEGANDEKHRVADEHRLELDLSKHKALLEASVKMNASLKRCQYVTDQLIREGKKALEYRIKPSEVKLGGRVVFEDEDADVDYIEVSEDLDHGGVAVGVPPLFEQQAVRHSLL
ncbi:hypothetical protein EDC01DRAFT_471644 [Geopyxis carbonaria]|nr:hypothetical protein EDC01DRAFT_471644 [Geopyxis carbonaria]